MEKEKVRGHCPFCNEETSPFPVYFNDDGRYKDVNYVRCMKCDNVFATKKEE